MSSEEFSTIGLCLCIAGALFLSRSILVKRSKRVVEEFFGVGDGKLSSLRHYVDAKHHVFAGCAFLILGFAVQLCGLLIRTSNELVATSVLVWEGVTVFAAAALVWALSIWMSRRSLCRYLRDFFQRSEWAFEKNMPLTREIGDLFEIPYTPEDSIEAYIGKVRIALGLSREIPKSRNRENIRIPSLSL